MITILVVGEPEAAEALDRVAARKPSLELLHARDAEDTLERLSRNRRIDAVLLLLPRDRAAEFSAVLREEDPGAPPLFAPVGEEPSPDVHPLSATDPEGLLDLLTSELSG